MNERFVHSELNGSLFKNDYKEKETHPDYKGKVMIGGKEMQIAGWNKEKQDGNTFISVRISEPYVKDGDPDVKDHPLGSGFSQKDTKKNDNEDLPF